MAIECTIPEQASGFYADHSGDAYTVIGISARHYIVVRHKDNASAHVTGDDAAKLAKAHANVFAPDSTFDDRGAMFAAYLDICYIRPALEDMAFIGVGLIDTGNRPIGSI